MEDALTGSLRCFVLGLIEARLITEQGRGPSMREGFTSPTSPTNIRTSPHTSPQATLKRSLRTDAHDLNG